MVMPHGADQAARQRAAQDVPGAGDRALNDNGRRDTGQQRCDVARTAHEAAGRRRVFLVGESEPQSAALLRASEQGGHALDALWNDDFHHAARVAASGRAEAYLSPYRGSAQELLSAARWGFLYQGQRYSWQEKRRGSPSRHLRLSRSAQAWPQ